MTAPTPNEPNKEVWFRKDPASVLNNIDQNPTPDELDRILDEPMTFIEAQTGNASVREATKAALHRLILEERREEAKDALFYHTNARSEEWLKSRIAQLNAEIEGSNHA